MKERFQSEKSKKSAKTTIIRSDKKTMTKTEVISRLKEHLKARKNQHGKLSKNDKYYCIHYVEDFLNMTKDKAIQFLNENLPMVMGIKGR